MTLQEFQKHIRYGEKINQLFYTLCSYAAIIGGLWFFYAVISGRLPAVKNAAFFYIISGIFLTSTGLISLTLLPRRLKIISIPCTLDKVVKTKLCTDVLAEYGKPLELFPEILNVFYKKRWWSSGYILRLTFDDSTIYLSVVGVIPDRGGFIDFGQTNRLRKKLISSISVRLASADY